jgi:hypothetical protein
MLKKAKTACSRARLRSRYLVFNNLQSRDREGATHSELLCMLGTMRFAIIRFAITIVAVFTVSCGPSAPPAAQSHGDQTAEPWYGRTVGELAALDRQANDLFRKGKGDDAAALIEKGEPLSARLLAVQKPTLAATEAASDLDQLYGQMLFSNRNYGWARLMFQKNVARWKTWKPQTPDTAARLHEAQAAIEECDRKITQ